MSAQLTPPHAYPCSCALCDDASEAREEALTSMFAAAVEILEEYREETFVSRAQLVDEIQDELTESEGRLLIRAPFSGGRLARSTVEDVLRRVLEKRLGGGL